MGDAPDDSRPPPTRSARRRRLPTGRNASPWSRRLVLGVVVLVLLAAPLWIDPLTLATFGGSRVTAPPPASESAENPGTLPFATDDPGLVWTSIAFNDGTVDLSSWQTVTAGTLKSAIVPGGEGHDVQVVFSFTVPDLTAGAAQVGALLRSTNDGAAYFATASFTSGGVPALVVYAVDGGQLRQIGVPVPLTSEAKATGAQLRLRAQVTGIDPATVKVRAWPAASAEPAKWQTAVIDWTGVLQHAGAVGIGWTLPDGVPPQVTDFQALSADEGDKLQQ